MSRILSIIDLSVQSMAVFECHLGHEGSLNRAIIEIDIQVLTILNSSFETV